MQIKNLLITHSSWASSYLFLLPYARTISSARHFKKYPDLRSWYSDELRAGRSGIRIWRGAIHVVFSKTSTTLLPVQWVLGLKWSRREVNHSPPSSAKVKIRWSCTTSAPIHRRGTGNDKFCFLFSNILDLYSSHDVGQSCLHSYGSVFKSTFTYYKIFVFVFTPRNHQTKAIGPETTEPILDNRWQISVITWK